MNTCTWFALGVVRKLLGLWIKGPLEKMCRVGSSVIQRISEDLVKYAAFLPSEFPRKCRPLNLTDRWKTTEFRQFLLYTGPVTLKIKLLAEKFEDFLDLFVGIYCISSPHYYSNRCQYVHSILCRFVKNYGRIYGKDTLVYNVHGLTHLADDVAKLGPLDTYSAFVFESYLGKLKRKIKKPNLPLTQVVYRLHEAQEVGKSSLMSKLHESEGVSKSRHDNEHMPDGVNGKDYCQFRKISYKSLHLSVRP